MVWSKATQIEKMDYVVPVETARVTVNLWLDAYMSALGSDADDREIEILRDTVLLYIKDLTDAILKG